MAFRVSRSIKFDGGLETSTYYMKKWGILLSGLQQFEDTNHQETVPQPFFKISK